MASKLPMVLGRGEVDEPDPVGKRRGGFSGGLDHQTGLAAASRPDNCDELMSADGSDHCRDLTVAADQFGTTDRQMNLGLTGRRNIDGHGRCGQVLIPVQDLCLQVTQLLSWFDAGFLDQRASGPGVGLQSLPDPAETVGGEHGHRPQALVEWLVVEQWVEIVQCCLGDPICSRHSIRCRRSWARPFIRLVEAVAQSSSL